MASRTACYYQMPQYRSCLSQPNESGCYNPLGCFSGGVCYCVFYMHCTTSDGWFEGTLQWHEVSLQTWRGNCISNSEKKTWVYSYIPHLQKVTQVSLDIKTMLILFFDCQGIVLQEFVPPGQVVNQHYFWKVCWKHPEQWWNQDQFIQHDSVLNWTALSVHSGTLKILLCSLILFAHLIWLLVISACFCEWDSGCESVISGMPRRFRSSFWSFYMWFQKVKFSSGRNAGHIA